MEPLLRAAVADATNGEEEALLHRLRVARPWISLTHPRTFLDPGRPTREARRRATRFETAEDLITASLLSSFIPGVTGRLRESSRVLRNALVLDAESSAMDRRDEFKGADQVMGSYWDGGLSDNWPVVDESTLLVTPIDGCYSKNPSIAPFSLPGGLQLKMTDEASIKINAENFTAFRQMLNSSTDVQLQKWHRSGYDHAMSFLKKNNMMNTVSLGCST